MAVSPSFTSDFPCAVEEIACDLCGSREHRVLFHASDTLYDIPGIFSVVRCAHCRLVYVNPRPTAEAVSAYYPASGYDAHQLGNDANISSIAARARAWIFAPRRSSIRLASAYLYNTLAHRVLLASSKPGKVLDIGCGTGGYLANWQTLGWSVEGIEPAAHIAEIARKRLNALVYDGTIEATELRTAHYDVVTMSHSLEHTLSPRTALQRAFHALKPGGHILIMVPNFASWERAVFGPQWLGLEVPRHLYHFEPDILRYALTTAGFIDVKVRGTATSGTLIRHVRNAVGLGREAHVPFPIRIVLNVAMVPAALARSSKALWAVGTKPVCRS